MFLSFVCRRAFVSSFALIRICALRVIVGIFVCTGNFFAVWAIRNPFVSGIKYL